MEVSGQLHVPGRFIYWLGEWVGPRTGLDALEKKNIPAFVGNRTPIPLLSSRYIESDTQAAGP
jgi:hypothetical protein